MSTGRRDEDSRLDGVAKRLLGGAVGLTAPRAWGTLARLSRRGSKVARKSTKGVDFERALDELEKLVERMEQGELSLEESLKLYERGIELSKACQKALDAAEKRIRILSEQEGKSELETFEADQD